MVATEEYVMGRYNEYNRKFFGGKLPQLPIVILNVKPGYIGRAVTKFDPIKGVSRPLRVEIVGHVDIPENELCNVIIHEMVHILDYVEHPEHYLVFDKDKGYYVLRGGYDAHGEWFQSVANHLSQYGFRVNASFTTDVQKQTQYKEWTKKTGRVTYLVVTKLRSTGEYELMKLNKKHLEVYKGKLSERPSLFKDCERIWVFQIVNSLFASYRSSLSTCYEIDADDFAYIQENDKFVEELKVPTNSSLDVKGVRDTFKLFVIRELFPCVLDATRVAPKNDGYGSSDTGEVDLNGYDSGSFRFSVYLHKRLGSVQYFGERCDLDITIPNIGSFIKDIYECDNAKVESWAEYIWSKYRERMNLNENRISVSRIVREVVEEYFNQGQEPQQNTFDLSDENGSKIVRFTNGGSIILAMQ